MESLVLVGGAEKKTTAGKALKEASEQTRVGNVMTFYATNH